MQKAGDNLPLKYLQPWGNSIHFILSLIFFAGSWINKNIQVVNMLLLMKLIFKFVLDFFSVNTSVNIVTVSADFQPTTKITSVVPASYS